jgi:hypothetical protein
MKINKCYLLYFISLLGLWSWGLFIFTALYPFYCLFQNPFIYLFLLLSLSLIITLGVVSIPVLMVIWLNSKIKKKKNTRYWYYLWILVSIIIIPLVIFGPEVRDSLRLFGFKNHLHQYQNTIDEYKSRIETNTLNYDQKTIPGRSKSFYIKNLPPLYPANPVEIRTYDNGYYLIFFHTGGAFPFTRGGYVYYSSNMGKKELDYLQKKQDIKMHWIMFSD